jgi:hypothetical protein
MHKLIGILSIIAMLIAVPVLASAHCGNCAMDHKAEPGQKQAAMQQEGHEGHSGMAAAGNLLDLGTVAVKGVAAMAHLKDVRTAMAKLGMKTTHHLMIMFNDEKTGKSIEAGTVAVKITGPDGTVTDPLELMGMQGHFGADVTLDKPGEYRFQVGSKLADGTARQYEFTTVIK